MVFWFDIKEKNGSWSCEEYIHEESLTRIRTQNTENQNATEPSNTTTIKTIDLELIKKTLTEKNVTLLPSRIKTIKK